MSSLGLYQDPAYRGDAPVGGVRAGQEQPLTSSYPRLIVLEKGDEERLRIWLDDELEAFFVERQSLLEDWRRWQTLYWAEPDKKVRNFPFKRSANIVVPLAALGVEAIHARFMNTLFSVEPFWSIRARSMEWRDLAKPMEEFLQSEVESSKTLNMYEFCNEWVMELCKLGTAVCKTGYTKIVKKGLRLSGDREEEIFSVVKDGSDVGRVPLGNFIMRFAETDPQMAPIVGERHEFTWAQLKGMAETGRMDRAVVEEIKHMWTHARMSTDVAASNQVQEEVERIAKTEPKWTEVFEVYELWCSMDVDGDGINEEIVVDYHKDSGKFLSIRYNWYDDLHRPYHVCRYLPVEGIWPGIGICKQVEQFQEEATTIHRQRLDNATLANMAQIAIRKGLGYESNEPIFPGKIWFVDNVQTDIKDFKLSETYPSSYANEESIVRYFEKRSGVNEVILGIPQEGTPGTATSDLTRLAEGNKRSDLVLKNVKRTMTGVGYDVVTNMQLFGDQNVHWITVGDDGVYVDQVLQMPSELVRRGAIIDLTVTDSITNKETEQQQWITLFQVLTGYYKSVFELTMMLAQGTGDVQMLMGIAQRTLLASEAVMRRLLDTFAIPDAAEFSLTGKEPATNGPKNNGGAIGAPAQPAGLIGAGGQ